MTLTSGGSFSFLKQSPKGTFKQKQWTPANFRKNVHVAMGDVNGDGYSDIVIAADVGSGSETYVLEQDPTSSAGFRESPSRPSLGQIRALVLHDMNLDGALDLVTREVDPTGQASVGLSLGVRESPTRFAGRLDVSNIGSSGQDGVSVDLGSVRRGLAVGDLDRNGFFDIFTELAIDGSAHVLTRIAPIRESPTFTRALQIDSPPGVTWADVQVADLNGDGKADFVTGGSDGLTVHFQDATSPLSFHSKTTPVGVAVDHVRVSDVDGDGRPDIGFSSSTGNLFGVVFHNVTAPEGFDPPVSSTFSSPSPRDVAIEDLDGDGRRDIATTFDGATGGAVRVNLQSAATPRSFTGFVDYPTGATLPNALDVRDEDCDDRSDIVCANGDGSLSFLRHAPGFPPKGASLYLAPVVYPFAGGISVAGGDLDGDGRGDIVTADPTGVTLTYQQSFDPRGGFQPSFELELENVLVSSWQTGGDGIADMDNDGQNDIVLEADTDGDGFTLLHNDPAAIDGFTAIRESPTLPSKGKRVATGDVNGDGWKDAVTLCSPEPGTAKCHLVLWTQIPGPH